MSKIQISGSQDYGHCGYCNGNGSCSFGLTCKLMRASDYDSLMVKGWRRCGNYYYKPNLSKSCCKLNTIRCNAGTFVANKSQRKVLNKFERFLTGVKSEDDNKKQKRNQNKLEVPEALIQMISGAVRNAVSGLCEFSEDYVKVIRNLPARVKQFGDFSITSCLIICSRNKTIDSNMFLHKLVGEIETILSGTQWQILNAANNHVNLKDLSPTTSTKHELTQMQVDNKQKSYTTELVPADYSVESFELYKRYQISVHKDPPNKPNKVGYEGFLCGKNILTEKPSENYPLGLGNYHQLHRIDGKLVAVGVLDILPSGISSVYFFYDPDYSNLSLGVLSALKELELLKSHMTSVFKYYYMGFYINTCQKMRYKGEYLPSELLCPVNYVWVDLEKCIASAPTHNFLSLHQCSEETFNIKDEEMRWDTIDFMDFLNNNLQIEINGSIIKLSGLNQRGQNYVISLMLEAQPYFSQYHMKRLVFKFN